MKRKLFLVIFALSIASLSFGQKMFTFGPKVGIIQNDLTTNWDTIKTAAKTNLEIGAFMRFSGAGIYFQPELLYVTKGGVIQNSSMTVKQEVAIQAIDVPLMFGLKIGAKSFNLRFHGGPVCSFTVNKTIDTSHGDSFIKEEDFNDINYSAQVGAGIDVLFLSLDVRYEYGINSIYKGSGITNNMSLNQNNYNISLAFKLL